MRFSFGERYGRIKEGQWRRAIKKSREKLKAEFIAEAAELFDELMEWEEDNEKPNLTQIEEIILKLRKRFGKRKKQKMIMRQEERQPAERVHCLQCGGEMVSRGLKGNWRWRCLDLVSGQ